MRIYVASSWRNQRLTDVVKALRYAGHEVYDFREHDAFDWKQIQPDWERWTPKQFCRNLKHPAAVAGYQRDITALNHSEAVVLVAPCGRSSHLELGIAIGIGIPTAILLAEGERPELSYSAADRLCLSIQEVLDFLTAEQDAQVREETP